MVLDKGIQGIWACRGSPGSHVCRGWRNQRRTQGRDPLGLELNSLPPTRCPSPTILVGRVGGKEGLEDNCQLTDLTQSRNVSQMIKQ